MKKRLYLVLLVTGLLLLAVAGWTVQGLRRVTPAFSS
jgi:outer membrane lipopolysaccharide assembly protein LptE/RlpB